MELIGTACSLAMAWQCTVALAQTGREPGVAAAGLRKWIAYTADNQGLPYLIIDKKAAHVWIYDADGGLVESSAVLLGSAAGDTSVPGIGLRPLAQIRSAERTTPAGRFFLQAGRNSLGEDIFWLDYDAAVSLHRVRPGGPHDQRLRRLATATAADNRISYGCVNLPIAVYNRGIHPLFLPRGGYAYVLPEVVALHQAFPRLTPLALRQRNEPRSTLPVLPLAQRLRAAYSPLCPPAPLNRTCEGLWKKLPQNLP